MKIRFHHYKIKDGKEHLFKRWQDFGLGKIIKIIEVLFK
jgi:hypothetical protein